MPRSRKGSGMSSEGSEFRVRWIAGNGKRERDFRQTEAGAKALADRLKGQSDDDYCECQDNFYTWSSWCSFCRGEGKPATAVEISRREVGPWIVAETGGADA